MNSDLTNSLLANQEQSGRVSADTQILVSVIIITWNRKEDVLETVKSVYEQDYSNFEIIVVDNGSDDGTVDAITKTCPDVRLIPFTYNKGVSHARNAGISIARGEIMLFLDSDASPARDAVVNIVKKMKAEPQIGVINSKIVNAYTGKIDNIAGWVYSENDKASQDMEFLSFSFSEGGCVIRKEVFDKIGLFWERLFFGYEGMEFSLRVLDAGYDILYYPSSLIYHRASPHSRIKGGDRDKLLFQSCLLVYLLRYPWWMFIIFMPLKSGATFLRSVRRGYFFQILGGMKEFILQSPSVIRERKPIQNKTALKYLELQRQHGSLKWDLITWIKYKT